MTINNSGSVGRGKTFSQEGREATVNKIAADIAKLIREDVARMTDEERRHLEYRNGRLVVDDDKYPWSALRERDSS